MLGGCFSLGNVKFNENHLGREGMRGRERRSMSIVRARIWSWHFTTDPIPMNQQLPKNGTRKYEIFIFGFTRIPVFDRFGLQPPSRY